MASGPREFQGGCNCAALGFSFETALPVNRWSVRACQCAFCRAHGALTTSDTGGRLAFHAKDARALQRYRFGLRTADFLICRRCGIYLGAQIETSRGAFGIVNVRTIAPAPSGLPDPTPANYGSENETERIDRREKRWTPMGDAI